MGAHVIDGRGLAAELKGRLAAEVAGISARLAEDGNPNLRGDAVTATALAGAGVHATAVLVEINVRAGGIEDDKLSRTGELLAATSAAQEAVEGAGSRGGG